MRQLRTFADNVTMWYLRHLISSNGGASSGGGASGGDASPNDGGASPSDGGADPSGDGASPNDGASAPLQMFHLVPGSDSGTGILVRRRQPSVFCKRVRHKRRGLRAGSERGSARGKSKGEFEKVAAFHDISLFVHASDAERVWSRRDERSLNRESHLQRTITPSRPRERGDPYAEGHQGK
jgi:hypothetical protein